MKKTVLALFLLAATPAAAQYSGSYGCTEDCSGHDAGYAWAEERGITDPNSCGGNSQSFIEGCRDYAEQQQATEEESTTEDGEACEEYDDGCLPEGEW